MDPYTIEDIELLRKKSGLSYQEAVALLDYHSGSLARALIDLEKNGRLKEDQEENTKGQERTMSDSEVRNDNKGKALGILHKLYRTRVKIHKGNTPIVNLSVLFGAACLLFAPHLTIIGVIISMILGYKFSFSKMDEDFSADNLEKMVKSAAQNAKSSVASVVQTISDETKASAAKQKTRETAGPKPAEPAVGPQSTETTQPDDDPAEALRKQTKDIEETMDSFFSSNPAADTYRSAYSAAASSVPTIQVPVQAETRDGTVEINDDHDGYSSVTIG